eukprot:8947049-Ditylum_brightwellii.AAC.1
MSPDDNDDGNEYDNTVGNQDEVEQAFGVAGQTSDNVKGAKAASPDLYERLLQGETEDNLPST